MVKAYQTLGAVAASAILLFGLAGATNTKDNDYNFDDLEILPAVELGNIGQYQGLFFSNIAGVAQGDQVVGLQPHSKPNAAAFTLNTEMTDPGAPASITTQYPGSMVKAFDAKSMYFGCVLATEVSLVGVTTQCKVTATGYAPNGRAVANQEFVFRPKAKLRQPQTFVEFQKQFKGLQKLVMTVDNNATIVAIFDDFVATLRY